MSATVAAVCRENEAGEANKSPAHSCLETMRRAARETMSDEGRRGGDAPHACPKQGDRKKRASSARGSAERRVPRITARVNNARMRVVGRFTPHIRRSLSVRAESSLKS